MSTKRPVVKTDELSPLPTAERALLRELARRQSELSALPIMAERTARWYEHNDLRGDRPMIHVEVDTFEHEILPALQCVSEAGRIIEHQLRRIVLNHDFIGDDRVIPPTFDIGWKTWFRLFDVTQQRTYSRDAKGRELGFHTEPAITNLAEDIHRLKPSAMGFDKEGTFAWKAFVEEAIGDILPVRIAGRSSVHVLTQDVVNLMGMEAMMFAMMDTPAEMHLLMEKLTADRLAYQQMLESNGLLLPTTANDWLCQGSFCFTRDLPTPAGTVRTRDVWGYLDSQETVGISAEMFRDFFWPYYRRLAGLFGLVSYGCCEPVHPHWAACISELTNLRKVSISAWCDEAFMGEALRGRRVIYHRKPSPNFFSAGHDLDEAAISAYFLKTLQAARGCKLEFSFRDIYTLEGNPAKLRQAVSLLRRLIEENWQ